MSKAKDIYELRDQILEDLEALRKDPRRHNQAKEMFNGAGKILAATKLVMEHHMNHGVANNDPFLGKLNGKQIPDTTPKLLKQEAA